jgi:hypothetical protein
LPSTAVIAPLAPGKVRRRRAAEQRLERVDVPLELVDVAVQRAGEALEAVGRGDDGLELADHRRRAGRVGGPAKRRVGDRAFHRQRSGARSRSDEGVTRSVDDLCDRLAAVRELGVLRVVGR